jgi:hypothetical protein
MSAIFKPLEFYVASNERISIDGQIACKQRIEAIFKRVKTKFNQILTVMKKLNYHRAALPK